MLHHDAIGANLYTAHASNAFFVVDQIAAVFEINSLRGADIRTCAALIAHKDFKLTGCRKFPDNL